MTSGSPSRAARDGRDEIVPSHRASILGQLIHCLTDPFQAEIRLGDVIISCRMMSDWKVELVNGQRK